MNQSFYFAPQDAQYSAWLANFAAVLAPVAESLGLPKELVNSILADNLALLHAQTVSDILGQGDTEYISTRNALLNGDPKNPELDLVEFPVVPPLPAAPATVSARMIDRHRQLVNTLRANPKVSPALAQKLGINPRPRTKADPETYQPDLKVTLNVDSFPELRTPLKGFKGYDVWRAVGSLDDYEKIGYSLTQGYVDTVPLPPNTPPGMRHYKVRMLGADGQPLGLFSLPVSIGVK